MMSPTLQITTHSYPTLDTLVIFELKGDLDVDSYQSFQDTASAAFEAGARRMILDLSGVTFMGSAGLRALHQIDEMLRSQVTGADKPGGKTRITNGSFKSPYLKLLKPSGAVARTIKLAGFDMIFDIYDDRQAAIDAF
jgi:anti-anti-sigma factor